MNVGKQTFHYERHQNFKNLDGLLLLAPDWKFNSMMDKQKHWTFLSQSWQRTQPSPSSTTVIMVIEDAHILHLPFQSTVTTTDPETHSLR